MIWPYTDHTLKVVEPEAALRLHAARLVVATVIPPSSPLITCFEEAIRAKSYFSPTAGTLTVGDAAAGERERGGSEGARNPRIDRAQR